MKGQTILTRMYAVHVSCYDALYFDRFTHALTYRYQVVNLQQYCCTQQYYSVVP